MRYISGLHEGETIRNIYLCKGKRSAETRNGKPYDNVLLQDKTGTLDGKVWDPNSQGIADYDEKDFIEVYGEVINYNGNLQINIKQIRKAGEEEYNPADYMPTTEPTLYLCIFFHSGNQFFKLDRDSSILSRNIDSSHTCVENSALLIQFFK